MKKKMFALMLTAAMAVSLAACGGGSTASGTTTDSAENSAADSSAAGSSAAEVSTPDTDYGSGEIKVWVADEITDFTSAKIDEFMEANPQFAGYKVTVEPVGEGDAAGNVITDVEASADIYGFAQDQIARLVSAGALEEVAPENIDAVSNENDAGAVAAATVGDTLYAYPLTSDNGYFLYYDKSVVSDPSTLEGIIADCEAAGKNFYMEINSGWYQTAFFFGSGAELTYETDDTGAFTACNSTYASEAGLVALKEMIELKASASFQNGSSVDKATNAAAIVDGTWDSGPAMDLFGENYACAKLPTFTGSDGAAYQLSGFGGFKLLGVKPQEDENKLAVCDALAAFLSSGEVQLARYEEAGWGPSNLEAQQSEAVKSDVALSALAEQLAFTIPQGQYPQDYWTLATSLGDSVISGELTEASTDDELMSTLQKFQESCISYAG
ncbi:MAG: extracellular solute-binding protein [Lachnospiraceae bacterium]|nr:extracellular solute-binding protein [Lachnospiraceae bacterium]